MNIQHMKKHLPLLTATLLLAGTTSVFAASSTNLAVPIDGHATLEVKYI